MASDGCHSSGSSQEWGLTIERDSSKTYREQVGSIQLPSTVETYADRYERVVGLRDRFLWQWIYNLFDDITLSSVPAEERAAVKRQKTLLTIFITTLDDLGETNRNEATFERVRRVPFQSHGNDSDATTDTDDELDSFLVDLWTAFEDELTIAPRYERFGDVFEYDLRQSINAIAYSSLLNDNKAIANLAEIQQYDTHNMTMFPFAGVDLMHSLGFDCSELGTLRSLLLDLQQIARIGNWLVTWERELAEGDCSSGIIVRALQCGLVTPAEIERGDEDLLDRLRRAGVEAEFLRKLRLRRRAVDSQARQLNSIDAEAMVEGIEAALHHQFLRCKP